MDVVEKILLERIKENKKIFTKDEISVVEENIEIGEKIYILGVLDANFEWPLFDHFFINKMDKIDKNRIWKYINKRRNFTIN